MKKVFLIMRKVLDDVCFLAGVGRVSWGAWQAWPPAGLMAAGPGLLAFALLIA